MVVVWSPWDWSVSRLLLMVNQMRMDSWIILLRLTFLNLNLMMGCKRSFDSTQNLFHLSLYTLSFSIWYDSFCGEWVDVWPLMKRVTIFITISEEVLEKRSRFNHLDHHSPNQTKKKKKLSDKINHKNSVYLQSGIKRDNIHHTKYSTSAIKLQAKKHYFKNLLIIPYTVLYLPKKKRTKSTKPTTTPPQNERTSKSLRLNSGNPGLARQR